MADLNRQNCKKNNRYALREKLDAQRLGVSMNEFRKIKEQRKIKERLKKQKQIEKAKIILEESGFVVKRDRKETK